MYNNTLSLPKINLQYRSNLTIGREQGNHVVNQTRLIKSDNVLTFVLDIIIE